MNGHWGYFVGGLLDGMALTYWLTGLAMKRAAKRQAQEAAEHIRALGK